MKSDFQARKYLAPVVILGSALLTVACGDDDNAEPTKPPVIGDQDAGGDNEDAGGANTEEDDQTTDSDDETEATAEPLGDASVDTDEPSTTDGGEETQNPSSTDSGVGTGEPTTDDSGTATDEPQGCVENEEACFSCPATPEQFLQQCTEGECKAFDNEERLGRYVAGEPLPEP